MGSAHGNSTRSVVSLWNTKHSLSRHGMSTAVSVESRIDHVDVTDETITAHLVDGRVISVPLAWSWRLSEATPAQRANWELIGDGHGIHWPDVDEDISAEGMLIGTPAPRPRSMPRRATGEERSAGTDSVPRRIHHAAQDRDPGRTSGRRHRQSLRLHSERHAGGAGKVESG